MRTLEKEQEERDETSRGGVGRGRGDKQ